MSTSPYQGRHRRSPAPSADPTGPAPTRPAPRSRLRTGVLLPTVATAAVVLTATGAHLGGVTTPSPTAGRASAAADDAARQQAVASAAADLADRNRSVADRAARDAVRKEVADRAAAQQAAAAKAVAAKAAAEKAAGAKQAAAAQAAARAAAARKAAADRAARAAAAAHRWVAPIAVPFTLTSGFGARWGSMHPGQDFAVPVGSPVMAMSSGTVVLAGWEGGYGNKVEIRYWDGTISWYAHNSRLQVATGDTVTPGQVVALSGNTGHSTGPHSHVEIHLGGDDTQASAVPPIPWLTQHGAMPGRASAGTSTAGD